MRVGIRSRLIITFLLAAILPVLISAAGMALVLKNSLSESGIEGIDNLVEANEVIKKTIEENFSNINNYSNFKNELQPYLDKYNLSLQIINKSGELILIPMTPTLEQRGKKLRLKKKMEALNLSAGG